MRGRKALVFIPGSVGPGCWSCPKSQGSWARLAGGTGMGFRQGWNSLGHISQDQALKIRSWMVHSSVCDSPLGELPPIDWIAYCPRVKLLMQIGLCLLFLQAAFLNGEASLRSAVRCTFTSVPVVKYTLTNATVVQCSG